jgi:hypothetical protein
MISSVVPLGIRFCERRGVLLVSLGCTALTVLSYLISPDRGSENVLISFHPAFDQEDAS